MRLVGPTLMVKAQGMDRPSDRPAAFLTLTEPGRGLQPSPRRGTSALHLLLPGARPLGTKGGASRASAGSPMVTPGLH